MSSFTWRSALRICVLLFVSSLILVPLAATILGGFKTDGELRAEPFGLPETWRTEFYAEILDRKSVV